MSEQSRLGRIVVVDAPPPYANALLNGSEGLVVGEDPWALEVELISGESAGSRWQLSPKHVRIAEASNVE